MRLGCAVVLLMVCSAIPPRALAADAPTPIPLDAAQRAFDDARLASDEDGGKLWGRALYGPLLLVDPQTRFVVANQKDGAGVLHPAGPGLFTGTLPQDVVIANTATDWGGTRWTMVMWGSISPVSVARRRLLLHECFHRIQDDLGLPAANADNPHLDTLDGRYWYRLELRALSAALRDADRPQAIADALAFRVQRRRLFPGAEAHERALEANEGLAEYTGFALRGTGEEETRLAVARRLDHMDPDVSFVRSFAYDTGPSYGLLLDATRPGWRRTFAKDSDLSALLAADAKATPAPDPVARAAAYDGAHLRAEEEKRDHNRQARLAVYRAALVEGPVIGIALEGAQYGFDPYTVVPLGEAGTVYPSLEVAGAWGRTSTETGARLDAAHGRLLFAIADRGRLVLNPGFALQPGARPGDLVVAAAH